MIRITTRSSMSVKPRLSAERWRSFASMRASSAGCRAGFSALFHIGARGCNDFHAHLRSVSVQAGHVQMPSIVRWLLRPPPRASKSERLRFVRRCALIQFPGMVAVWGVMLAIGTTPTWLLIALGVATAIALETIASLTWRIRRLDEE